jgi:DNA ligase (NAD+)
MSLSEQTQFLQGLMTTTPLTTLPNIKDIYQQLIDTLTEHNHLYYVKEKPIISDTEYDQLFDFLKRIEEEFPYLISGNSPTQSLIGQVSEGFTKAQHKIPLLSLENSYNPKDLYDFDERTRKVLAKGEIFEYTYRVEPKYDGLSVELIYSDGEFVKAITRGDGITGEDITLNVKTIKNLPKKLYNAPALLSVRGEIMMPISVWKALNTQREQEKKEIFANTRNAAAGSIKLLDSGEVAKRNLFCFVYDVLYAENADGERIGCELEPFDFPQVFLDKTPTDIQGIEKICLDPAVKSFLNSQDFDFDGLVIKVVNQQGEREILGSTTHHPRRGIAYKFPAEQASTQILSVDFQVGRSGVITPIAHLSPVKLSGAEISRVSLHNFDFIRSKEIKNLDFVRVQRSGEVIPHITGVIKERRTGNEELIVPPLFCSVCHAPITNVGVYYYCANPDCPAQVKEKIFHFVSKNCMDIQRI